MLFTGMRHFKHGDDEIGGGRVRCPLFGQDSALPPEKNRVRRDGGRDVKPHDFETELKIYFDP